MSAPFCFLALAVLILVLAGAFFAIGNGDNEDNKDYPPHSVQQ